MNDYIEMIRQQLMKAEWPHGGHGTLDNTLAALDRLEAELIGYKNEAQHRLNTMGELGAEVERLREELYEVTKGTRWNELFAEKNRLVDEVERLRAERDRFQQLYGQAQAENEKLRSDVAQLNGYGEDIGWIHAEEVEKLRGLLQVQTDLNVDLQVQAEEQQREVERLQDTQAELESWRAWKDGVPPTPSEYVALKDENALLHEAFLARTAEWQRLATRAATWKVEVEKWKGRYVFVKSEYDRMILERRVESGTA